MTPAVQLPRQTSWRGRLVRFHFVITLLVLAFTWLFFQSIASDVPQSDLSKPINQAQLKVLGAYQATPPPSNQPGWTPVKLPHRQDTIGLYEDIYSWYVFDLEVPEDSNIDSVYIPRLAANAEVFVDGQLIEYTSRLKEEKHARNWNRPLIFSGSTELRKPGRHTIAIQVRSYKNHMAGISTVWVGPLTELRSAWLSRTFNQIGPVLASTVLMMGGTVILFILSVMRPTRRPYLVWLILAGLFWTVRSYLFTVNESTIGYENLFRISQLSLIGFFLVIFYLVHRYLNDPKLYISKWVIRLFWMGTPLLIITLGTKYYTMISIYGVSGTLACVWGIWHLLKKGIKQKDLTIHAFAWGMVALFVFSLNDLLLVSGIFSFDWYFLNQYLGFVIFLAIAYFMSYEYSRMLNSAREFNSRLQAKLNEQELQLRVKHQSLQNTETQKAQLAERQRIMADMHDGLGAHLVSAIHQLRNDSIPRHEVLELLEDGLRDLQLTIDSLEPIENDLSVLVGAFRYRISTSLNASNIKLNWKVAAAIPPLSQLDPQMGLMVLRILQEVFTNILKHSHATEVTFQLQQIGQNVELEITDNGVGFDVESASEARGKGIGNMKHRASQIGATLSFISKSQAGTCVCLTLPLEC